jgi:hypothetical protein
LHFKLEFAKFQVEISVLYPERGVQSGRIKADFLNLRDPRPLRTGNKVFLKLLYLNLSSFSDYLDASIRTVTYVPHHLMTRRGSLREEAIPNALHVTRYQKLPRHFRHCHSWMLSDKLQLCRFLGLATN